jgi:Domain of Unknown Function (DUF1080)
VTCTPLFTGTDLSGWTQIPRSCGSLYPGGPDVLDVVDRFPADYQERADTHPARWTVEDGAVVGRQDPPGSGYGGYRLSEEDFGDFELVVEAKPDWPADTGIMIRRRPDSWAGLQILVDHRKSGSIGGFFGNGIASFHAVPLRARRALRRPRQRDRSRPGRPRDERRAVHGGEAGDADARPISTSSCACGSGATGTSSGSGA